MCPTISLGDNTKVHDKSKVLGDTKVYDGTKIEDEIPILNDIKVSVDSPLENDTKDPDNTPIQDDTEVHNDIPAPPSQQSTRWRGFMTSVLDHCPVISQAKSTIQVLNGDRAGAIETQKKFLSGASSFADGFPVLGHVKGSVHYAMGDREKGDSSMKAATRSVGVMAGGAGGFLVGGPVGAFCGGSAAGTAMDAAITKIDSKLHGEYRPYGSISTINLIKEGQATGGDYLQLGVTLAFDGFAGLAAGQTLETFQTSKSMGVKTSTGNATQKVAQEATQGASKRTVQRTAEQLARRAAKRAAKQAAKLAAKRAAEGATKEAAKGAAKAGARAAGQEWFKQNTQHTNPTDAQEATQEASTRTVQRTAEQLARRAAKRAARRAAKQTAKSTAEGSTKANIADAYNAMRWLFEIPSGNEEVIDPKQPKKTDFVSCGHLVWPSSQENFKNPCSICNDKPKILPSFASLKSRLFSFTKRGSN